MRVLQRYRWFVAAALMSAAFAAVSLLAHRSWGLTAFSDISGLVLLMAGAAILLANALAKPSPERGFWALMAFAFALWAVNQGAWVYCEVLRNVDVPDPYFADVVLFFHLIPMIAAVGWRPDATKKDGQHQLGLLDLLMLTVWWIFLYAFVVMPHQFVVLNVEAYDLNYLPLYNFENLLLLATLFFAGVSSKGAWRKLYLHFLGASALYSLGSEWLYQATLRHVYYSGSFYDAPLFAAVAWMCATALAARQWKLQEEVPTEARQFETIMPQLAMLALLSLPLLGMWSWLEDRSPGPSRVFRLFAVLGTMLILGAFVFFRQYLQDQAMIRLLEDSRSSYENRQRLQSQLVQKEKLASLGQLVAGAAKEIDPPLATVMDCSERLWSQQRLSPEQSAMVRKIVNQAQRTRELVFDLLSFAQQAPGGKAAVDIVVLLNRASQMLEARHAGNGVNVEVFIEANFPRVLGNAHQLFQAFVEIIENSLDALEEFGEGSLKITALRAGEQAVIQFADNGPGIREPERVFDPFYTTKPVGKGTGLGLSAVYGVVQDHDGHISCQNKPEGGALFILRLPWAEVATAAKA